MLRLPLSFYQRDTATVARELLGKKLVRIHKGQRLAGIITEVEAYLGLNDKACHSFGERRTKRTEVMYAEGGCAYVYFIYGMYDCFNVVTQKSGVPEAVLIRALEPVEGIEYMQAHRNKFELKDLTTGPGKLAQALKICRKLNGLSLMSEDLFIEDAKAISRNEIIEKTRIGVSYAKEDALLNLRFYVKDSKFISKK